MIDRTKTIREQVVETICEGFTSAGHSCVETQVFDEKTLIFVGDCDEPIVVELMDVIVPDGLEYAREGIILDVRALIALNAEPE